jgi:hypothetical protein
MNDDRKISDDVKIKIMNELIEPSYYGDVNDTIKGRKCWRISGHVFETMSKVFLAVTGIISFSAGVYHSDTLSFIAGAFSTISLATFQISGYSFNQSKKNTLELNQLLAKLDIEQLPVFENKPYDNSEINFRGAEESPKNEEEIKRQQEIRYEEEMRHEEEMRRHEEELRHEEEIRRREEEHIQIDEKQILIDKDN